VGAPITKHLAKVGPFLLNNTLLSSKYRAQGALDAYQAVTQITLSTGETALCPARLLAVLKRGSTSTPPAKQLGSAFWGLDKIFVITAIEVKLLRGP